MKRRKRGRDLLYICLVVLALVLPVCLIPVQGETISREKRELATMPELWQEDGLNLQYATELEKYLADHLAGRSLFTTGYHWLIGELLGSSPTEQVIVGEEDWLFYGETMEDYRRTNQWTEAELAQAVKTLQEMQDYVESQGADFLFVIAPNKNSLYPEYMPYYELASGQLSNAERLLQAMEEQGVGHVDLFSLFRGLYEKSGQTYYHQRDSHWNAEGAYLGYQAIMKALGRKYDAYAETVERREVRDWEGDLDALIYPELGYLDWQVEYDIPYTYVYESRYRSPEDVEIVTSCENREGRLYMIRDSFGNVLFPYLAEQFGHATFSRQVPWKLPQMAAGDVVVIELVERNLDQLLEMQVEYAPVVERPAEIPESDATPEPEVGEPLEEYEPEEGESPEERPSAEVTEDDQPESEVSEGNKPEEKEPEVSVSGGDGGNQEQMTAELSSRCQSILSDILTDDMSEREQAYAIYKWTESHVRYSGNTPTDSWVDSALLTLNTGKGNCFGYYSVSRALLTEAGFLSTEVRFPNNGHYWNLVQMADGCWYHFDTTTGWGGERFLLTDEELAAYTYRDLYYEWAPVELPERNEQTAAGSQSGQETAGEADAGSTGEGTGTETGEGVQTENEQQGQNPAERPSSAGLDTLSVRLADGTVLSLNQNMAEVAKKLGEPTDYMESVSCMYDGMDKTWVYPSVIVKTYPKGEKDYIQSIEITAYGVAVAADICVGDPVTAIFDVYGESEPSVTGFYEYGADGYGWVFYVDPWDQVEAIEVYLK